MTTQQELQHASFRAILDTAGTYGDDAMAAMRVELEDAALTVPETFNGRMVAWLQYRLNSTDTNLPGLMQAFAKANGASSFRSLGHFDPALPSTIEWPTDANFIDVTDAPYSADPTGVADSTAAIQAAVDAATGTAAGDDFAAGTVYLPLGTYRVTAAIKPTTGAGIRLCGAGKTKTTIRLDDNVFTSGGSAHPVFTPGNSGGLANSAFAAYIQHLTIDVGSGNLGAVAIQADIANSGAIEHVILRSTSGQGYAGIYLAGSTGNAYANDIEIHGFAFGIRSDSTLNNDFIFENVSLYNQTTGAILCVGKNLWFQNLYIEGAPYAAKITAGTGVVGIINGRIIGSAGGTALQCPTAAGYYYLRNIRATGWDNLVTMVGTDYFTDATDIVEWASQDYYVGETPTVWPETLTAPVSLNLPIRQTPEYHTNDLSKWAAPQAGAGDRTAAIQAAIDSGAVIVYLPYLITGYQIDGTVYIRNKCRKLDCMFSPLSGAGEIQVADVAASPVIIENLNVGTGGGPFITNHTARPLCVRNGKQQSLITSDGGGDLFLSNLGPHCKVAVTDGHLWARQLDHGVSTDIKTIDGATAWFFGDNCEPPSGSTSQFVLSNGAKVEIIGGAADAKENIYAVPMVDATDSYISAIMPGFYRNVGSGYGEWGTFVQDDFGGNGYTVDAAAAFTFISGTNKRFVFPLYRSPQAV